MTYIKWRDADGYETGCRECLDLSSFAADLCKALDGKPISTNDRDGYATFELARRLQALFVERLAINRDRQGGGCASIRPMNWTSLRGYDLSIEHRLPASRHCVGQTAARPDRC